jgi:F420-non-reducing hydrogenase iron-sulfur subunit
MPENESPAPVPGFEPRIVAFFCNWCTYTASDLAGTSRMTYAPNTRVVRLMCSGRLDLEFVLVALREGADGVLIGGCHPGDCHYREGNYKALRRFKLLQHYLEQMGIERDRVRLEWIAASEGDRVQKVTNEMTARIRELGPVRRERLECLPLRAGEAGLDRIEFQAAAEPEGATP